MAKESDWIGRNTKYYTQYNTLPQIVHRISIHLLYMKKFFVGDLREIVQLYSNKLI
jgi:hypothetical protein